MAPRRTIKHGDAPLIRNSRGIATDGSGDNYGSYYYDHVREIFNIAADRSGCRNADCGELTKKRTPKFACRLKALGTQNSVTHANWALSGRFPSNAGGPEPPPFTADPHRPVSQARPSSAAGDTCPRPALYPPQCEWRRR